MAGYPGSIASTWQQAGRAGRRAGHSLAILIARSSPMDQFIVEHPDYFFSRSPEHCRINPDNLLILLHHLKSAAFELPFEKGERFGKENWKNSSAIWRKRGSSTGWTSGGTGRRKAIPPTRSVCGASIRKMSSSSTPPMRPAPGDCRGGLGQRLYHRPRRCHLYGRIPAVPCG